MASAPSIVWLRRDLRTDDHPALSAAAARGNPVIPVVFVEHERFGLGPSWWLRLSLAALDRELRELGGRLLVRTGPAPAGLARLVAETGASHIDFNSHVEPLERAAEADLRDTVEPTVTVTAHRTGNLFEPGDVLTGAGTPYLIYTPFANACLRAGSCPRPLRPPAVLPAPDPWPVGVEPDQLGLPSDGAACDGHGHQWEPGSHGAARRLHWLVERRIKHYGTERDRPDLHSTSGLSPHLAFGEISPRRLWHAILHSRADKPYEELPDSYRCFLGQVLWREFAQHVLWFRPELASQPLRPAFARLPWRDDAAGLLAWQQGQTGYPMVDAGMRQLLRLGWMHNRVRMIVASFMVKDLLLPWQQGAAWFAEQLVDLDEGCNGLNWQWSAGCGIDSSVFTRVFNPMTQGAKFDPEGRYVRRWVPELAQLPDRYLHAPWTAPDQVLATAGVRLGETYPQPIVDHAQARLRALAAYASVR